MAATIVFAAEEDLDEMDDTMLGSYSNSPHGTTTAGVLGTNGPVDATMPQGNANSTPSTNPPKVKAPGGHLGDKLRALVSQRKERYKEQNFDLDFTYITPRIIAMGFPSSGTEAYYRNPMDQVENLLEHNHAGHYKVYNLCSERQYDRPERFRESHATFAFDDHHPPMPFSLMTAFVADANDFLDANPKNVIVVHCKAGKGRTGTMIAALFLSQKDSGFTTAAAALQEFARVRTSDGKGVTIPSQKRYVAYYQHLRAIEPRQVIRRSCKVVKVELLGMGSSSQSPFFKAKVCNVVAQGPRTVFDSRKYWKPKPCTTGGVVWDISQVKGLSLHGDVMIDIKAPTAVSEVSLFRLCFNVDMECLRHADDSIAKGCPTHTSHILFEKANLDIANKDKHHKKYPSQLAVKVSLEFDLVDVPAIQGEIEEVTYEDAQRTRSEADGITFTDLDGNFVSLIRKGREQASLTLVQNGVNRHTISRLCVAGQKSDVLVFPEIGVQFKLAEAEAEGRERGELLRQLMALCASVGVSHDIDRAGASASAVLKLDIFGGNCVRMRVGGPTPPPPLPFTFDARDRFYFLRDTPQSPRKSPARTRHLDVEMNEIPTDQMLPLSRRGSLLNNTDSISPVEILHRPRQELYTKDWKVCAFLTPTTRVQVSLGASCCGAIPPDATLRAVLLTNEETMEEASVAGAFTEAPISLIAPDLDAPCLWSAAPPLIVPKCGVLTVNVSDKAFISRWVALSCNSLSIHASGSPTSAVETTIVGITGVEVKGRCLHLAHPDEEIRATCESEGESAEWAAQLQGHSGWYSVAIPGGEGAVRFWQILSNERTPRILASAVGGLQQSLPLSCCGNCTLTVTQIAPLPSLPSIIDAGVKVTSFLVGGSMRDVEDIAKGFLPFFKPPPLGSGSRPGSPRSPRSPRSSPREIQGLSDEVVTIGAAHTESFFESPSFPFAFLGEGVQYILVFAPDAELTPVLVEKLRAYSDAALPVSVMVGFGCKALVGTPNTTISRRANANVFNAFASNILDWISTSGKCSPRVDGIQCAS